MSTIINQSVVDGARLPAPAASAEPWEGRFHGVLAAAACAALAISLGGWYFCRLTLSVSQAMPLMLLLAALAAGAAQYRLRGERKCFQIVMMAFWIILVTNAHFFPMYMAARRDVPMQDALLARADQALGLEVPQIRAGLASFGRFNRAMLAIYMTLIPLMVVAAILPPIAGRMDQAKQFVIGCIVAAAIALPIFACLQAEGPWHYYDFEPPIPSLGGKAAMLATLKTNTLFVIDVTNRDGLITFPSFHVVLTVLAAGALWPFRLLRWPAVIWASLIVISTVTTGIHYTIDAVGGLFVAAVAMFGARAYLRWETRAGAAAR